MKTITRSDCHVSNKSIQVEVCDFGETEGGFCLVLTIAGQNAICTTEQACSLVAAMRAGSDLLCAIQATKQTQLNSIVAANAQAGNEPHKDVAAALRELAQAHLIADPMGEVATALKEIISSHKEPV